VWRCACGPVRVARCRPLRAICQDCGQSFETETPLWIRELTRKGGNFRST
jgi:hypothetical protein